jgi:MFS family permease
MQNNAQRLSMARVLLCGGAVVTLSMGIRHGFGLWLQPITQEMGWTRESFALALAVQNLSWGVIGIFTGMLADRFGASKVLVCGALLYALGLAGMAWAPNTLIFTLTAGLLIGMAQTGTTYAVIYGVIGRQLPAEKRSWAMGVAAAAGSFGQFFMVPVEGQLIANLGWQNALLVCAVLVLTIVPLAFALREPNFHALKRSAAGGQQQTIVQAVAEAFRNPSFLLLTAGYFVCGFQVMFIGVHMPSYLKDFGLPPHVASYSLALIGLFNIFGTYLAGSLGQRMAKRYLLSGIYFIRAIAIMVFLLVPLSPWSVYVFAAVMGFLWLSTVPLTNGAIAQIFGVQHLSMLSGFVFFSHQIGSFLGIWLGGYLYDHTGSYDVVWYVAIGLGVFAGLVNLPVKEEPVQRLPLAA